MGRRRLMEVQARPPRKGTTRPGSQMMDYSVRPDTVKVTVTTVFAPGMV